MSYQRERSLFDLAPHNRGRGSAAEEAAADYLRGEGYEVLEANATTKVGEIDLVAKDGGTLCFIEVKARRGDGYGPAIAAVTPAKQRRLARAASMYLAYKKPWNGPVRFDVLGMDAEGSGWRFTLLQNAFEGGW